jgi:serine/threonine protein kinase
MIEAQAETGPAAPETGVPDATGAERAAGAIAGKYRLTRRLGRGGMGVVYAGVHLVIGRPVALKFLHPRLSSNEVLVRRLRREATAAGALVSEHIGAVTDFETAADGTPFIVMELLEGESLAERLRRGPLSEGEAIELGVQICRGLAVAHDHGIVHRDLTPSNVFLCRTATGKPLAKILDFGIAVGAAGHEEVTVTAEAPAGTAPYMAPEQVRGHSPGRIDGRVDIYALGAILYECLAGQRAHPGATHGEVVYQVLRQSVTPLRRHRADVSRRLGELVHRALAFDPRDRFCSAHELESALAACAHEPAVRPFPARRRYWRLGLMLSAPALAAVLMFGGPGRSEPPDPNPRPTVEATPPAPTVALDPPSVRVVGETPAVLVSAPAAPLRHKERRRRPIARASLPASLALAPAHADPPPAAPTAEEATAPGPEPVTFQRRNPYR